MRAGARAAGPGVTRPRVLERGPTYVLVLAGGAGGGWRITCTVCGRTSAHPDDCRRRYCPACARVHAPAAGRPAAGRA